MNPNAHTPEGTHPEADRLAEFAEARLEGEDRDAVEAHLVGCEACRDEVAWTRILRAEAAALPRELEPPSHLWSGIRGRIDARERTRTVRFPVAWLAAAAVLLVALSSAVTLQLARTGPGLPGTAASVPADPAEAPTRFASLGEEAVGTLEEAWAPTLRELEAALVRNRDRLSPETLQVLEENLRIIDGAIRDAREALAADPASVGAARALNGMYETRVQVLRQAAMLQAGA
jgi:hypothetical protein